jgi:hypothetical protein
VRVVAPDTWIAEVVPRLVLMTSEAQLPRLVDRELWGVGGMVPCRAVAVFALYDRVRLAGRTVDLLLVAGPAPHLSLAIA